MTTTAAVTATVTATAGTKAGAYEVLAFTPGGQSPALFALTNTAGAPSAITADPQTTPQNAKHDGSFAQPLRAIVTDACGNPVSGAGSFAGKAIDLCADGDPICSDGRNPFAHTHYESSPFIGQAAGFAAARV